jgi:hypothetical protein
MAAGAMEWAMVSSQNSPRCISLKYNGSQTPG